MAFSSTMAASVAEAAMGAIQIGSGTDANEQAVVSSRFSMRFLAGGWGAAAGPC